MRIAQLISGTGVGGPARCCAMLSRQLQARGHAVTLFHRPGAWIAGDVDPARTRLVEFGRGFAEIRRVNRILRESGIEVLHTHLTGGGNFGVLLRLLGGPPVVATLHSGRPRTHWRFNNRVIALSPPTFDRARKACGEERVSFIPNFMELPPDVADGGRRAALRRGIGVGDATLVIGTVGKVTPEKGQRPLVEAVAKVRRAGVDCHLLIVGPIVDGEEERLARIIRAEGIEGRVTLTGLRGDVPELLQAMDVYAAPSEEEQMSIAVMEAMAAGLPILATKVGGMPLLVAEGGNGFLTDVGAVDALAERLTRLAASEDLRREMGAASRTRIATEFSPGKVVPEIEAKLAEAAAEGRGRKKASVAKRHPARGPL
jgi:glycosyltransferase involved in cell wall biosynthesis